MTDTVRPSTGRSELRRTIQPWDTDVPLISADPFSLDADLVIAGEEYIRCTERNDYTLTGCDRGLRPEKGGVTARKWVGGTPVDQVAWSAVDIEDAIPVPTLAMVGRQFAYRDADGNVYTFNVVTSPDGTPIIDWVNEPPGQSGMAFLWASLITGLTSISGVALDPSGNIYTCPPSLKKYNAGLALQWTAITGTLRHTATDGTTVFASNPTSNRVEKYLTSTGAAGSPATFGSLGTGNGQFASGGPIGVVFDGTNAWIVDTGNNRVQKFTASTGAYVSQFDSSSSGLAFSDPTGIAIGPTSTHLYVLDPVNGRIVKFLKSDHSWVATFDLGVGNGDGQISTTAEGIALDVTGRIWIADTGNHRIQVFDSAGALLGKIGSFGSGDEQFKSPKQLSFNAAGDTAYVADSGNNRLVTLQEDTGQITPVITERTAVSAGIGSGAAGSVTATCNAGEVVISGGCETSAVARTYLRKSRKSGNGWECTAFNDSAGGGALVTASAMCMKSPL